jgi:hypothetical protein
MTFVDTKCTDMNPLLLNLLMILVIYHVWEFSAASGGARNIVQFSYPSTLTRNMRPGGDVDVTIGFPPCCVHTCIQSEGCVCDAGTWSMIKDYAESDRNTCDSLWNIRTIVMLRLDSAIKDASTWRVIWSRDIALVHDSWAVVPGELSLSLISKAHV